MTNKESIAAALEYKAALLGKKTALYDASVAKFQKENPQFSEISNRLSACGARLALTALGGSEKAVAALKEEMTSLFEEKTRLLKEAGIEGIDYECKKCSDTGRVDGELCECVTEKAKELLIKSLSESAPLDKCTFSSFDLSYYTDEASKKRMTAILKKAKEYALNFNGETSENLLFMGNTGVGKTHLSLAIVGELISRGFDVLYGSAYNLFSDMESEHFSKHTNEKYENAVSCDLLVIDDLGGEFVSPYIQSLVYNIINTRLLCSKPTVINTNLTMRDMESRYTPRVASRLSGEYTAKMFLGNDIRQIKALS